MLRDVTQCVEHHLGTYDLVYECKSVVVKSITNNVINFKSDAEEVAYTLPVANQAVTHS